MARIQICNKESNKYLYNLKPLQSYQDFLKGLRFWMVNLENNTTQLSVTNNQIILQTPHKHHHFQVESECLDLLPRLKTCFEAENSSDNEQIVLAALAILYSFIKAEANTPLYNIVRIMTVLDNLHQTFLSNFQNDLGRMFVNEGVRLLLTTYDLAGKQFDTSSDWARLDLYAAYPSIEGKIVKLQRNDIVFAATTYWQVDFGFQYPSNFEYGSKFGSCKQLKQLFYNHTEMHDNHFKLGQEAPVESAQDSAVVQGKQYEELQVEEPELKSSCWLFLCQFFDVAWPLAVFLPPAWIYLAARLVNGGERLTTEKYSFFSCFEAKNGEEAPQEEDEVLAWNLQGCFKP